MTAVHAHALVCPYGQTNEYFAESTFWAHNLKQKGSLPSMARCYAAGSVGHWKKIHIKPDHDSVEKSRHSIRQYYLVT